MNLPLSIVPSQCSIFSATSHPKLITYQSVFFPSAAVMPSPTKGHSSGETDLTSIIPVVAGVVGGLVVVFIVVCIVVRVRLGRCAGPQCGREVTRGQTDVHEESTSVPLHPMTPVPTLLPKILPPTTFHDTLPPPPVPPRLLDGGKHCGKSSKLCRNPPEL